MYKEHDIVRVLDDIQSEGYTIPKGVHGTIISVHNAGEAYTVEIADIEQIVTISQGNLEIVWQSPE
jgi:hypothetical protein